MKKGFTLVELLAVIVILAVILVIAVPQISNVITQTKKNSLGSTAKLIAAKAEEKEIENDVLGIEETMTCASLVTLDDNYGNCTVTKSNGHWTVTIDGAGRFAGYRCTGTKSGMSCSDTSAPEYLYSFGEPQYDYDTYVVKPGKAEECKHWLLYDYWGYEDPIDEFDDTLATNICNNSDDIYGDGSNASASEWLESEESTLGDGHSFLESEILNGTTDYTTLKYPDTNTQAQVFMRWGGVGGKSVCTLYGGNLNCFEATSSAYETNKSRIETLFGSDNCYRNGGYISCGDRINPYSNDYACSTDTNGYVGCQAPNYHCATALEGYCGQGELD